MTELKEFSSALTELTDNDTENHWYVSDNEILTELDADQDWVLGNPGMFRKYPVEKSYEHVVIFDNVDTEKRLKLTAGLLKILMQGPTVSEADRLIQHSIFSRQIFDKVCGTSNVKLNITSQHVDDVKGCNKPYSLLGVSWSVSVPSESPIHVSERYRSGEVLKVVGPPEILAEYLYYFLNLGNYTRVIDFPHGSGFLVYQNSVSG
jgi:hypothetical protein